MKYLFIWLPIILFVSFQTHARKDCPEAKVVHVQIEGSVVLYRQEQAPWRRLGVLDDAGTKERYSALLAAQMAGRQVVVAYARDSYDCSKSNYAESAYIVRTY
ncbi:hypothetical protein AAOGI_41410 [Agarivorans albus]